MFLTLVGKIARFKIAQKPQTTKPFWGSDAGERGSWGVASPGLPNIIERQLLF
jgi:hypothetical protein